jgi:very-short-patch-repair endonuclease
LTRWSWSTRPFAASTPASPSCANGSSAPTPCDVGDCWIRQTPRLGRCLRPSHAWRSDRLGWSVQSQVYIPDVGRVDLLIDGWLVIEIDGYAHHSSREQFRNDRRRANLLSEKGLVLLRFSYEDVMHRCAQMVAQIRFVHASR